MTLKRRAWLFHPYTVHHQFTLTTDRPEVDEGDFTNDTTLIKNATSSLLADLYTYQCMSCFQETQ